MDVCLPSENTLSMLLKEGHVKISKLPEGTYARLIKRTTYNSLKKW